VVTLVTPEIKVPAGILATLGLEEQQEEKVVISTAQ
jgi:hypothetical protein